MGLIRRPCLSMMGSAYHTPERPGEPTAPRPARGMAGAGPIPPARARAPPFPPTARRPLPAALLHQPGEDPQALILFPVLRLLEAHLPPPAGEVGPEPALRDLDRPAAGLAGAAAGGQHELVPAGPRVERLPRPVA